MNTYSRALRHINMKDVKQKHQKKLIEKKVKEEKEEEEKKYIQFVMEEKKYDWREKINEGMTTTNVFFATLPATGDTDLVSVDAGDPNTYYDLGQSDTEYGSYGYLPSTRISSSGNGSGINGGFSLGTNYLAFNGKDYYQSRGASLNTLDTSSVDTIAVSAIRGNDTNGGITPTSDLLLYYYNVDTDEYDFLTVMSSSGPTSLTKNIINLPKSAQGKNVEFFIFDVPSSGLGNDGQHFLGKYLPTPGINNFSLTSSYANFLDWAVNLPQDQIPDTDPINPSWRSIGKFFWDNILSQTIGWGPGSKVECPPAPVTGGTKYWSLANDPEYNTGYVISSDYIYIGKQIYNYFKNAATYGVANISFQRRTPKNVVIPLDKPEASAFIRSSPMMANLSPQERLQKLKEMLESSDEYVMKILGSNFPGTGAVPPGEYDLFAQAPPGQAGDTPGVEISQLPPGPSGYKAPGTYDPKQFYPYSPPGVQPGQAPADKYIPSPNLPQTGPGLSKAGQDTQIAADYTNQGGQRVLGPHTDIKYDKQMKMYVPASPRPGALPQRVLAHYEPSGKVIIERRKLKSPQEFLNKIPGYYDGKPAPLGFPETPPPEMKNGMHPDLVDGKKVADRFNRMDPESAKAMPLTGNPHIDKKVKTARKKPK